MRDAASFVRHASSRSAIVTGRSPTRPTTSLSDWAHAIAAEKDIESANAPQTAMVALLR